MGINFKNFISGIRLVPKPASTSSEKGDLEFLDDGLLYIHDGTSASAIITADGVVTLTNKTIDADQNTITNIDNNEIKTGANIARNKLASGTASVVVVNDGSGVLSDSTITTTELGYLDGLTENIQTSLDDKANISLDNLDSTAINTDLLPDTDSTHSIGSSTNQFLEIYSGLVRAADSEDFSLGVTANDIILNANKVNFNAQHASDPGSPNTGDMYYNTTSNSFRYYDGSSWEDLGSGSGGGANTTLSNLDSPTELNQDLLPDTNLGRNLGGSLLNFAALYVNTIESSVGNLNLTSEASSIIDLTAQSVKIPVQTSDPSGVEGCIYYNTVTDTLRKYDGTSWSNVGTNVPTAAKYRSTTAITGTSAVTLVFGTQLYQQGNISRSVGNSTILIEEAGLYLVNINTMRTDNNTSMTLEYDYQDDPFGVPVPPILLTKTVPVTPGTYASYSMTIRIASDVEYALKFYLTNATSASANAITELSITKIGNI